MLNIKLWKSQHEQHEGSQHSGAFYASNKCKAQNQLVIMSNVPYSSICFALSIFPLISHQVDIDWFFFIYLRLSLSNLNFDYVISNAIYFMNIGIFIDAHDIPEILGFRSKTHIRFNFSKDQLTRRVNIIINTLNKLDLKSKMNEKIDFSFWL